MRSEKHGRRARWHLTDEGRRLLIDGTQRIYGFGGREDTWDGRWLVVLCSVPEEQRAKRHQLRSRLGFAGFGFLGAGVAVSTHLDREATANAVLKDLGLLPGAVVFRAETGDLVEAGDLLRRAWDLDALAADYAGFVDAFGARDPEPTADCFAALVDLVHEWRRFPFVDPEIPARLLPARWPGRHAKDVFDARHASWSPAANSWYEALKTPGSDAAPRIRPRCVVRSLEDPPGSHARRQGTKSAMIRCQLDGRVALHAVARPPARARPAPPAAAAGAPPRPRRRRRTAGACRARAAAAR